MGKKAFMVKLPWHSKKHLTFCIKTPSPGTIKFDIHLSDETKPKRSRERFTSIFSTRPIARQDLSSWGHWLKVRLPEVLPQFLQGFFLATRLVDHAQLLKEGFRGIPTTEILAPPFLRKKDLVLSDIGYMEQVEGAKQTPSRLMMKMLNPENLDSNMIAIRVDKTLKAPRPIAQLQNEFEAQAEDKTIEKWVDEQVPQRGAGPYYMVIDSKRARGAFTLIFKWILEGGKQSFGDREMKDKFEAGKNEVDNFFADASPAPLFDLLGFDPRRLASPEPSGEAPKRAVSNPPKAAP